MTYKNSNNQCGHIHVQFKQEELLLMLSMLPFDTYTNDGPRQNNLEVILSGDRSTVHYSKHCSYCFDTGFIQNFLRSPIESYACPNCLFGAVKESLFYSGYLSEDDKGNPLCESIFIKNLRESSAKEEFKNFNILFGKALFTELKGIGSSDKGIQTNFMHFKAGTKHFDVYRWIEKHFPPFSVAKTTGLDPMPYV